jgi:hypothetical protein
MTSFTSRLGESKRRQNVEERMWSTAKTRDPSQDLGTRYDSGGWFEASAFAGVRYRIRRISIARKIELARLIREAARGIEFLEASGDSREKLEAAVLAGEIDRVYLSWGLEEIEGLVIDGEAATVGLLIERGPLELAMEIIGRIKSECGLSDGERKN